MGNATTNSTICFYGSLRREIVAYVSSVCARGDGFVEGKRCQFCIQYTIATIGGTIYSSGRNIKIANRGSGAVEHNVQRGYVCGAASTILYS